MRLRITFSKQDALRYTGHLDLHRIWERTIRRAGLPLAYSQGFHPQPKIQIASALPLGFASRAEVVDIWLNEDVEPDHLPTLLNDNAPAGLRVLRVKQVDERSPALQTQVQAADYEVHLLDEANTAEVTQRVVVLMDAATLPRVRRKKNYDLRPLIEVISVITGPDGHIRLRMHLSAREGATGRPDEVLDELSIPIEAARIERTKLTFKE